MCPHLDALDTEEDDESDNPHDFGAISEHPVNFIESMSHRMKKHYVFSQQTIATINKKSAQTIGPRGCAKSPE